MQQIFIFIDESYCQFQFHENISDTINILFALHVSAHPKNEAIFFQQSHSHFIANLGVCIEQYKHGSIGYLKYQVKRNKFEASTHPIASIECFEKGHTAWLTLPNAKA